MQSKGSNGELTAAPCSRCGYGAAPSEGEANAALCHTIAKALGIAPRQVTLAAGAASRSKRVRVAGDPAMLAGALRRLVSDDG
jgi:uncharacterized protein YggU (UPF0235/DUF167 family)